VLEFHFKSKEVKGVDIEAKMAKKEQTVGKLDTNKLLHIINTIHINK
jgi:hypothetical protein